MKKFILWAINFVLKQQWVSMQEIENLSKPIVTTTVEVSTPKIETEYLHQLFVNETIAINSTDGMRTIAEANAVFTGYIDPEFVKWGLNKPSKSTKKTKAIVCEMTKDGIFSKIFGSLGRSLDDMCFTQSQIIDFSENHKDKLR
ncbi:MAG: hypothetical protein PHT88_03800 [Candidatus Moranbacteria bacterium]|nr:hypothetical protein [Candidatus Moranbacteria bacterium]